MSASSQLEILNAGQGRGFLVLLPVMPVIATLRPCPRLALGQPAAIPAMGEIVSFERIAECMLVHNCCDATCTLTLAGMSTGACTPEPESQAPHEPPLQRLVDPEVLQNRNETFDLWMFDLACNAVPS